MQRKIVRALVGLAVVLAGLGLPQPATALKPGARVCFAVAGSVGDAAIVNLTPVQAAGAGNGQLVSSDVVSPPVASNVNFGPGSVDPNVAVARIGSDGRVCFVNSDHTSVHLVADHLGTIAGGSYTPARASGAPDRKLDTRSEDPSDPAPTEVELIALMLDYEVGYGGYVYPVYNPYVFFKTGVAVKEPKVAIDELRLDALTKDQAQSWGTYERVGGKVKITFESGSTTEKDWPGSTAYPANRGEVLSGPFSSFAGGGNLAIGGSVGVLSYSSFTFTADGWFTNEKLSGGSSSSHSAFHQQTTAGRYEIDGHTITLSFNSGEVARLFFCYYGTDREVFRIAGRTYTPAS